MDLSKLPRLSETDKHAPAPTPAVPLTEPASQPAATRRAIYVGPPAAPIGPEAWISFAIGAIIELMSSRFWAWIGSKLSGSEFTAWTFTDSNGAPVSYTQSVFFTGDLAMVLFGLVLILEGVVYVTGMRRRFMVIVFGLTCVTTLFNLFYLIQMMTTGYGLQLMAAVAVALGVYMSMNQWRMLKSA